MPSGYDKKQLEDALVAILSPLLIGQGGVVTKIAGYGGELDEDKIAQFAVTFPSILIAHTDSPYAVDAYPYLVETSRWAILVGDRNLRGRGAARAEGPQGTYGLLPEIRKLLHGKRILTDVRPATLLREVPLALTATLSIYSAEYELIQHVRD